MLPTNRLKRALVTCGPAGALACASVALATSPSGVAPETFVTSELNRDTFVNHDRIKFQTKGQVLVRMQKITFSPGGTTGWHHHPGLVIVAVQSGSITLRDERCGASKTFGPGSPLGSAFVEGHDEAHIAKSTEGAVVYVTYVDPDGTFRVDEPAPCTG